MIKKAILFDCDGTLIDTERMCATAVLQAFAEYGYIRNIDEFLAQYLGVGHIDIVRDIKENQGIDIPFPKSMKDYEDRVMTMMPDGMTVLPETLAFVRQLATRADLGMAVCSNGEKGVVLAELLHAGYLDFIPADHVFTAADVKHPKPAPDMYLMGAAKLGVKPADCIVVEDSPAGASAGVAAGMYVVGYTGFAHNPAAAAKALENAGCAVVLHRFEDLLAHIG